MTAIIHNPILPGFHPDPSILRVGRDYYLATSTFEWWPGVRIHHSRDLINWRHAAYALTRVSQLDLRGDPDSGGVWAPCLSYHDGTYYLVYTNVRSCLGAYKDAHNYVVTAPHPSGPWSEPSYLNSIGFDPSFFHDDDGRTWLVGMKWDHRPGRNFFAGIYLREYSRAERRLIGEERLIFAGTSLGYTEGPHLYRKGGYYYLLVAEGGTEYEHACTIARSRALEGPYEVSPHHPLLTSVGTPRHALQRAGHGSLVETESGEWYLAHLCSRPVEWQTPERGDVARPHSLLGRETALQRIIWTPDGWPRLATGGNHPEREVAAKELCACPAEPCAQEITRFDGPTLSPHFNSLRQPADGSWLSLCDRPGWLRLYGRESFRSLHDQSLVARRVTALRCRAETELEFAPTTFQQMAGLVAYYNTMNHAYLRVTHDHDKGCVLGVIVSDGGIPHADPEEVVLGDQKTVWLRVEIDFEHLRFFYGLAPDAWQPIGGALASSLLSDEHATCEHDGYASSFGFTGAFVGVACQDLSGGRAPADFHEFGYYTMHET